MQAVDSSHTDLDVTISEVHCFSMSICKGAGAMPHFLPRLGLILRFGSLSLALVKYVLLSWHTSHSCPTKAYYKVVVFVAIALGKGGLGEGFPL